MDLVSGNPRAKPGSLSNRKGSRGRTSDAERPCSVTGLLEGAERIHGHSPEAYHGPSATRLPRIEAKHVECLWKSCHKSVIRWPLFYYCTVLEVLYGALIKNQLTFVGGARGRKARNAARIGVISHVLASGPGEPGTQTKPNTPKVRPAFREFTAPWHHSPCFPVRPAARGAPANVFPKLNGESRRVKASSQAHQLADDGCLPPLHAIPNPLAVIL